MAKLNVVVRNERPTVCLVRCVKTFKVIYKYSGVLVLSGSLAISENSLPDNSCNYLVEVVYAFVALREELNVLSISVTTIFS